MKINNKLSIEKLRKIEGYENLTEEEGEYIIVSLEKLCFILLKLSKNIN